MHNPFDSIESAQQYIGLLIEQVEHVEASVGDDMTAAEPESRRFEALRLVSYKLGQLRAHLTSSGRALNDLRVLRRLLFNERELDRLARHERVEADPAGVDAGLTSG